MKIELDEDETWELMSLIVGRMLDETKLPAPDRAKIRRWRSESMGPSDEPMRLLTRKINEDLAQTTARKKRSQVRKPDWK